jgi:hypothetical protein
MLPKDRRRLLLEAAVRLTWYKGALWVLPFRWIAPRLGRPAGQPPLATAAELAAARRITWAVHIAARNLPWHSRCLVRAVTAKIMLQRRGLRSTLYLGVRRGDDLEVASHAWLRVGELSLIGGPSADYTVLASFADDF